MAKTIDERVVDLDFDNRGFESGVSKTMKTIEALKKALNFKGAGKGLEQIDDAASRVDLSHIASGVDVIKDRFSLMGAVAFTIIQDLTRRAIDMGSKIANALVIDPVKMGFNEYETKMNAVQTILANTSKAGVTLADVNDVLEELNVYADQTIYNFTEMTKNIGTFTAAGIDLDTSAAAIKGIANLAAISGSNSHQASTAMYQLSQALSSGTLKLQDWNSVVNAGMGGQIFQDALQQTAEAHGVNVQKMIDQNGSFRQSLQEGWITKDILTETLSTFTGDLTRAQIVAMGYAEDQVDQILELGVVANDAATKVKTLTQLGETLEEAMQSGWTQSWEIMIGDFNEAKSVLTQVSDLLGGFINTSAEARNELLRGWKELGGRDSIINTIFNAFEALQSILGPIKEAFQAIFPPVTAQRLADISKAIEEFSLRMILTDEGFEVVKKAAKGFFAALDIARMIIVDVANVVGKLVGKFLPPAEELGTLTESIADWILKIRNGMKAGGGFLNFLAAWVESMGLPIIKIEEFVDKIKEAVAKVPKISLDGIKEWVGNLDLKFRPLLLIWEIFAKLFKLIGAAIAKIAPMALTLASSMGRGITAFLEALSNGLDNFDPASIFETINSGLFAAILLAIARFVNEGAGMFDGIADLLDGVGDTLQVWQNNIKSQILLRIAAAIGILAVSLALIASVDGDKLDTALLGMTVMIVELFAAMKAFSTISSGIGSLATMTLGLIGIATALLIIAGAVKILAKLDAEELTRGGIAMAVIVQVLVGAATALSKVKGAKVLAGASAIAILAGALNVVALAVFLLGKMDPAVLVQGLGGMAALLLQLGAFVKLVGGSKGIVKTAIAITILAAAMNVMVGAIFLLGSMDADKLEQGLFGLGSSLLLVAAAMRLMPPNMLVTATGLIGVAGALLLISMALRDLGGMTWEELTIGLTALGGSLAIIAIALYAMSGTLAGSAALLVASVALIAMSKALKTLASMSLQEIGIALLAIAGTIAVLGIATAILTPLIPSLLAFAAALTLIGIGALFVGAGVLALSAGLAALAVSGAAGISVLMLALTSIISLLPFIVQKVAEALIILIQTIANHGPQLLSAIIEILLLFIEGVVAVIPPLVEAVILLIETLLVELAARLPAIVQAGWDILIALLTGIRDNIGEVVELGADIMIELMDAMGEKVPELIDSGWDMMIDFIDGIADSAERNIPRLIVSMNKVGKAIVTGIIAGFSQSEGGLIGGIRGIASALLSNFKQVLGIESPSKEFFAAAGQIVSGLINGVKHYGREANRSAEEFAEDFMAVFAAVADGLDDAVNTEMEMSPLVTPIMNLEEINKGANTMQKLIDGTDLSVATAAVGSIATNVKATGVVPEDTTEVAGDASPVQYIQNNYSPKALSRIEVYRQTKNQLRALKGAVIS